MVNTKSFSLLSLVVIALASTSIRAEDLNLSTLATDLSVLFNAVYNEKMEKMSQKVKNIKEEFKAVIPTVDVHGAVTGYSSFDKEDGPIKPTEKSSSEKSSWSVYRDKCFQMSTNSRVRAFAAGFLTVVVLGLAYLKSNKKRENKVTKSVVK